MSLYVLDTDHLSLYRYGHPEVSAHIEATSADQLAVTIITIEEQLRAWYTQVRRARGRDRLARAYQGLFEVAETSNPTTTPLFDMRAVSRYVPPASLVIHQEATYVTSLSNRRRSLRHTHV